jgi:hypothetical protein
MNDKRHMNSLHTDRVDRFGHCDTAVALSTPIEVDRVKTIVGGFLQCKTG